MAPTPLVAAAPDSNPVFVATEIPAVLTDRREVHEGIHPSTLLKETATVGTAPSQQGSNSPRPKHVPTLWPAGTDRAGGNNERGALQTESLLMPKSCRFVSSLQ
jgi:hypothetical protein